LHRMILGDFELTILSDGIYMNDGGAMFGVIPKVMWEKRATPDERNRIPMGTNSLLVRTGDHNVVIDTGIGPKLSDKRRAIYDHEPRLLKSFAEAGVAPDEIDIVINTHLHFDHCGWNTYHKDGKPAPTFPRARYYVQEGELHHAHEQHERDRVSYMTDNYDTLAAGGQMQLLKGDREIAPGIAVKVYPGHTRDLQAVILRSGGQVACYPSDLVPDTAHLEPMWVLGYDLYPLQSIDNKHRFYDAAIPGHWLLVFTHDAKTPWAYVERSEKGLPVARTVTEENTRSLQAK